MGKPITWELDSGGCWNCTSHCGISQRWPYPTIMRKHKKQLMSHFIYENNIGEIPKGLCVLHSCDNPRCINPAHLFLGTLLDNVRDRCRKGRSGHGNLHGEQLPQSKLSEKQIKQIRKATGTLTEIAKKFNISDSHASAIRRRTKWKHVA